MKYKMEVSFYQIPCLMTIVEVEADNEEDAQHLAFDAAREKIGTVCGDFDDSGGDCEVINEDS